MTDGHHTNGQRVLYHAVQTAYWACEAGQYDVASIALSNGLDAYQADA
jgi:hypothetical protein